jgi:metal-sulfur cluster biosynthetic enzyme
MDDPKPIDIVTGTIQQYAEEDVWEALRECYDPEIPVNIVDLGLVYDVKMEPEKISVKMTLTAPGCGMGPMIAGEVKGRLSKIPGIKEADVQLVFTPLWNPNMMTEDAKKMLGMP